MQGFKRVSNPIGLIGCGFVGSALQNSFNKKGTEITVFDKYKNIGNLFDLAHSEIIFLCLPTPFVSDVGFDLSAIEECLSLLPKSDEKIYVLKSTVTPGTTRTLSNKYGIKIIHNPEFLTQRTAFEDFDNQKHIVLGLNNRDYMEEAVISLYSELYPEAKISICTSEESETMKLFCNNFYAQKVMIFNEFYNICQKSGINFNIVKNLMLENGWINAMHTQVPGPDGQLGYGGACFIKDTMALLKFAQDIGAMSKILQSTIEERNQLRDDMTNII